MICAIGVGLLGAYLAWDLWDTKQMQDEIERKQLFIDTMDDIRRVERKHEALRKSLEENAND